MNIRIGTTIPGFHILKEHGASIYSIEQPDRFARWLLRWVGQYPIRFLDQLLVTVDLTPTARKGRTIQFELVADLANEARAVEFIEEYGGRRFSPPQTVRNQYVQRIR